MYIYFLGVGAKFDSTLKLTTESRTEPQPQPLRCCGAAQRGAQLGVAGRSLCLRHAGNRVMLGHLRPITPYASGSTPRARLGDASS